MMTGESEIEAQIAGPGLNKLWDQHQSKRLVLADFMANVETEKPRILPFLEPQINVFAQWLSGLVLAYDPAEIVIGGTIGAKFWRYWEPEILAKTDFFLKKYPVRFSLRFSDHPNIAPLGAALLAKNNFISTL